MFAIFSYYSLCENTRKGHKIALLRSLIIYPQLPPFRFCPVIALGEAGQALTSVFASVSRTYHENTSSCKEDCSLQGLGMF